MLLALFTIALLLLLPGGLMLLAPWRIRPFLSVAFWVASWWWIPRLGPGRSAFLQGALVAFFILGLMRFLKPIRLRGPSRAALCMGLAAVSVLAVVRVRPSSDAAFDAMVARLLADRDGIPRTSEPLLPVPRFPLRPPGYAGLAADVSGLSGAGVLEGLLAAAAAAHALLAVGAFHVLRRRLPDLPAIALGAVLALLAASLGLLSAGTALSIALGLAASPHVASREKAPTVASGVLLGAAVLSGGAWVAGSLFLAASAFALRANPGRSDRLLLGAATAFLVAMPALVRGGPAAFLESPWQGGVRSAERLPSPDERAAMAWLERHAEPLAVVCAASGGSGPWIPGLAGRGAVVAGRPAPFPIGMEAPVATSFCTFRLDVATASEPRGALFRSGAVTLVEISKSLR